MKKICLMVIAQRFVIIMTLKNSLHALKCIILDITSVRTDNVASKMKSSLVIVPPHISYPHLSAK